MMNTDDGYFKSHIWDLIDREMLLRAIAMHLILDSRHTDDGHNWKLYLNPYRARFEPVLWNLACLQYYDKEIPDDLEIERFGQLLYDRAMSDPRFLSDLCEFIYGFVWRDLTPDGLLGIFDELIARVRPSVRADEFKDQWLDKRPMPLSNQEFERVVELSRKRLKSNLDKVLAELHGAVVEYSLVKDGENTQVLIRYKSKAGLVLDRVDLSDSQGKHPTGWKVYLDLNDDGLPGQEDSLLGISENGVVKTGPLLLLSNRTRVVFDEMAALDPKVYRTSQTLPTHCRLLVVKPDGADGELGEVRLNLLNRATGEAVTAEPDRKYPNLMNPQPMSPDYSNLKPKAREKVVFGKGLHRITEDRVYGKNQDLVFEPGAVMEMAEGASIVVHGSLKILGTEREPVVFRSAGIEPWGVLAVQSPVEEVVVSHLRISGGSEDADHPVYYSGMFSVYDGDLVITNSVLEKNRGEDGLNVKNGRGVVEDCLFIDLYGDAIDFDKASGRVERSVFRKIRNDAIDYGGSQGVVKNVFCSMLGDKSVSVGERSSVKIDHLISHCVDLGVAVKDESKAEIADSLFIKVKDNHSVYRKNLHFAEAGRLTVAGLVSVDEKRTGNSVLPVEAQELAREILDRIHGVGSPLTARALAEIQEPGCRGGAE